MAQFTIAGVGQDEMVSSDETRDPLTDFGCVKNISVTNVLQRNKIAVLEVAVAQPVGMGNLAIGFPVQDKHGFVDASEIMGAGKLIERAFAQGFELGLEVTLRFGVQTDGRAKGPGEVGRLVGSGNQGNLFNILQHALRGVA